MLYIIIRIVFWIAIFFLVLWICKKKGTPVTKRVRWVIAIITLVFITIFGLIPMENFFVTFPSPQAAFNYSCVGEIMDVVDGNDSCMVIYKESKQTFITTFFLKEGMGYKLGTHFSFETVYAENHDGLVVEVYMVKNTEDYYVSLFGSLKSDRIDIADSANSNFVTHSEVILDTGYRSIKSHAFVEGIDDGYSIQINDTKIQISP